MPEMVDKATQSQVTYIALRNVVTPRFQPLSVGEMGVWDGAGNKQWMRPD